LAKSIELAELIYKELKDIKDYGFKDQIQRAVVSISNNIAEWFERQSNKEFKYFLFVAKWSCWETKSMLYLANKLWYISKEKRDEYINLSIEISKMIYSFIKTL